VGRCDRIIRSALHRAEQTLAQQVTARLDPDVTGRLAALAATAGDGEVEVLEPSALALSNGRRGGRAVALGLAGLSAPPSASAWARSQDREQHP
jgi:hypothetical protein